jgi:uncharacterized protein
VRITWDSSKDLANQRKHGVSFSEASELFQSGRDYLEIYDHEHSVLEDRFLAIGRIRRGVVLVVWTERDGDEVRLISARWAERHEQAWFQEFERRLT